MTFADTVRAHLEGADLSLQSGTVTARALGISHSTLRRKLRSEGACYQALLDNERQRRVDHCLHLYGYRAYGKRFADELGYQHVNSFYRAYKRWHGVGFETARMAA